MKLYKVWLEIEEFDPSSGQYRDLGEEGVDDPVPVAVFSSLTQARRYAEAFAMDGGKARHPWMMVFNSIN